MAQQPVSKISYELERVIEPLYLGGDVALGQDGRILATSLGEDAVLTNLNSLQRLARIEGDGETITALTLTPDAEHLLLCSRSLSARIFHLEYDDVENKLSVSPLRTQRVHSSPVVVASADATSTLVALGASDGTVKVLDVRGGYTTHTLHGHGSVVSALHFFQQSAESKRRIKGGAGLRLAAGFEDGKVRIWNLESRKTIASLDAHVSVVRSLDYDSSNDSFLSSSRDKTASLWNALDWQLKTTIPVLETIESAGFLDASTFFTAGERGVLRLWSATKHHELTSEDVDVSSGILQVIHHTTFPFIVAVHVDQTFTIHSTTSSSHPNFTLPIVRHISGTHDEVIDLGFVGEARELLAVASNVEQVKLLSANTVQTADSLQRDLSDPSHVFGSDVGMLSGHSDIVICIDIDWSGRWLVSGGKDHCIKLWRIDSVHAAFTCYATLTGHIESIGALALPKTPPPADTPAFQSPLDHPPPFILSGSQDKTIKRWDIKGVRDAKAARATYTRKAHDKDINALDVHYASALFASASQDKTVKIWSLEDGETVGILRGHQRSIWSVKFAPKGTPPVMGDKATTSAAKGLVLTGSSDKTVKLWNLADYSCIRTFEGHTNSVLKVQWRQPRTGAAQEPDTDGSGESRGHADAGAAHVLSAAGDGLVKVWDANSGEALTTLDNHTDRVWSLVVNPTTDGIVSAGGDGVISFWKDTTSSQNAAAAAASSARIEQDQQLQNYMRDEAYREAITLALQLRHPARLLSLFTAVTNKHPPEEGSVSGVTAVDEVLRTLDKPQMLDLLARLRDWNASSKTAVVAQKILWALFKLNRPAKFLELSAAGGRTANIRDVLDALRAYTERHYGHIEEMIDESYLLDFTLREMTQSGFEANGVNGIS